MGKRIKPIQVRIDEALDAALAQFVRESATSNRSEVIRSMLWHVLADDAARGAVSQVLYEVASKKRVLNARISEVIDAAIQESFPTILQETFGTED